MIAKHKFGFRAKWGRARRDTKGFREWPRNALVALVVAVVTYFLQRTLWSREEAVKGLWLSVFVFASVFILLPAFEFALNFIRAPRRILEEKNELLENSTNEQIKEINALRARLVPKIAFKEEVFKVLSPTQTEVQIQGKRYFVPGKDSLWVQVVPQCLSEVSVEGCRGHLLRVRRWSSDKWENTLIDETLPLGWSLEKQDAIALHPGVDRRLNVFVIYEAAGKIALCDPGTGAPLRARDVFDNRADVFRFDVKLTATECVPATACVEVMWGHEWNDPFLAFVLDSSSPAIVCTQP